MRDLETITITFDCWKCELDNEIDITAERDTDVEVTCTRCGEDNTIDADIAWDDEDPMAYDSWRDMQNDMRDGVV